MSTSEKDLSSLAAPSGSFFEYAHASEPVRAELYSLEHLENHARHVAEAAVVRPAVSGRPLLWRFLQNRRALVEAHRLITQAVQNGERFGSDAEWLLDNFHIIGDALDEIHTDLPSGYYKLLPKLATGPLSGFPRVYTLSLELIAHSDSSLDETNVLRFVQAYQTVTPLTIGELWAVPIMLRLVLVENLRRLADQILQTRADRNDAKSLAAQFLSLQQNSGMSVLDWGTAILRRHHKWSDHFIIRLLELVCDQGSDHASSIECLEGFLRGRGLNAADILRREQQRQAANQVSIGNCVTSLRLLSALDWTEFFERTSLVEAFLREDPPGVYARQDVRTRDRYRQAIERLARGSGLNELEIVRQVLALARRQRAEAARNGESGSTPPSDSASVGAPQNHVGYYLLDHGRAELEAIVGYRPTFGDRFLKFLLTHPAALYFGSIAILMIVLLFGLCAPIIRYWGGSAEPVLFALAVLILLLPASEVVIGLLNQLVAWLVPPRILPKLHFQESVPPDCATFVVVPSMLFGPHSAALLLERLEIHYLANPDPHFWFALLTDFADAQNEQMPGDDANVRAAADGIKALNERYSHGQPDRFFLCHRRRLWNPVQNCWMGWERKRGKLLEFVRLLRGSTDTSFATMTGNLGQLPRIRFIITLDADTQLPRETARRLIAALAHPLNRPRLDDKKNRVVAGYGILQPRVSLSLTGARRSLFTRIFAASAGLDLYTTAVSDIYQDLFGVGSFTGKGIFEIDAFAASVGHTFPENRILSHDLIEGNYARCGLVTDIELIDEFPARYSAYAQREHRWVRGDWQILDWLYPTVPGPENRRVRNPLPAVERWKIFDNLRRSLLPPCLIILLVLGWTVLPGPSWFWTVLTLSVLAWPLLLQSLGNVARSLRDRLRWSALSADLGPTAAQVLLGIVFLAHQARMMADAVMRTLGRLYLTRRHLLEWETAASAEHRLGTSIWDLYRGMWTAPVLALALALVIWLVRPVALVTALPLLACWLVSPLVAFWVSRPCRAPDTTLPLNDMRRLHRLARKTWSFFEEFVSPDDHWLPPDNYQEVRKEPVAHRTSPTNVGLYLLSTLAAHDFGYVTLAALIEKLHKTFATLATLERWHGHFYNWYDTRTLKSLQPGYVSTVDSGNLLACLLALKHGLIEKAQAGISIRSVHGGLTDTLELVTAALRSLEAPREAPALDTIQLLETQLQEMRSQLQGESVDLDGLAELLSRLEPKARGLTELIEKLTATLREAPEELRYWTREFYRLIEDRVEELRSAESGATSNVRDRLNGLAAEAGKLGAEMDFRVLYNDHRHLFAVGYNLSSGRLDNAHYDLLASEACLTSFLAIARDEVPRRHWFQVGRPLTRVAGALALLSWGGTMFEYLMPRLLLPSFPDTLLDESQRAAVARQIEYGKQCHVPWGISESAFSTVDADLNYQYQAFGVPGLGLKRGLAKDLVIAPYATFLALPVGPRSAVRNLDRMTDEGGEGRYGFYEAVDFTSERLGPNGRSAVVRCYMAHHQGMSLLALANCLLDNPMPRRLRAEPIIRATELLLQERVPRGMPLAHPNTDELASPPVVQEPISLMSRRLSTPHTAHPRTHLVSSGQYTVMVTNSGAGYSTCRGLDVTRWREDRTCDSWGQFCYVRNLRTGAVWSAGYQPIRREADEYEVVYSTDKAEFRRVDAGIETHLEVAVSPENHAEIRRLTLTNHSSRKHFLEVTSYAEIVLGPHSADLDHPAFGKLFLETEFLSTVDGLLCRRRPRSEDQKPLWAVHVVAVDGPTEGLLQYETDRARFLGRGRTPANPAALDEGAVLSGTVGAVLDPIFSLRRWVRIAPGTSVSIAFTTAVANSREEALVLADHYHDFHGVTRAFELAWAHSQVELRHLQLSGEQAHLYQRLASHVIYAGRILRADPAVVAANHQGQPALWRHGISGDIPIVLVRIAAAEELSLAREALAAHHYWRLKGLEVDLVILNEHESGYFEDLHQQLQSQVRASDDRALIDKPGGVFVRKAAHISKDDLFLLQAAARCVLAGKRGSLAAQLDRLERPVSSLERLSAKERRRRERPFRTNQDESGGTDDEHRPPKLLFANGRGGFSPDGCEYIIRRRPPAPWINVVANPSFGFLVSETGAGYTWASNSQLNRLTPWNNDPVLDPAGEVLYLRDEATGDLWTAAPAPVAATSPYVVRHGQGYTIFEHQSHGVSHELLLFVPVTDPIKLICLKIRNLGRQRKQMVATFYSEWVLGSVRDRVAMHVVSEIDPESGALLARNSFNPDYSSRTAFADVNLRPRSLTSDRTEFLGRNGSVTRPAALTKENLAGTVGAVLDPCAALQARFELRGGEEKEIVFVIGEAPSVPELHRLLRDYRENGQVAAAFAAVKDRWNQLLSAVQVHTPNPSLDLLLNRWLLYQVLSCRVWGRSALYQSSGAYGFRDQLQDVMALVYAAPADARAHILQAASRQFREGDVQHWWHPVSGGGVRTRISDDFLWLPFVVCHYVATTGDAAILDETIPFLQQPMLRPDQHDDYRIPEISDETAPLYEHCARAIERGCRFGDHGLPLMGAGDWNDGMNLVGKDGRGESLWNAWFLIFILREFAEVATSRGAAGTARQYREKAELLRNAIETHGWDGKWYRRAYFDDGTPLGSATNDECRIDSLTQSWAVLSGAADPKRAEQAMAAVNELLVRQMDKQILLFTPPFDRGELEPGYIKGYLPGIRENGGQYTHAAAWVVQAEALLGDGNRAMELFDMLNPILHVVSPADLERYRVEPYVAAGDTYAEPSHAGQGGWTWYTGSASWLYRVALESILGFQRRGNKLRFVPCIPDHWTNYQITYRHRSATYEIKIANPRRVQRGIRTVTMDGNAVEGNMIELADDGQRHQVQVILG
jgi:cyclic beta-1,2-glucan synthetase